MWKVGGKGWWWDILVWKRKEGEKKLCTWEDLFAIRQVVRQVGMSGLWVGWLTD